MAGVRRADVHEPDLGDDFPEAMNLILSKITYSGIWIHTRLLQEFSTYG